MYKYLKQLEVARTRELLLDNPDKVRRIDSIIYVTTDIIARHELGKRFHEAEQAFESATGQPNTPLNARNSDL